ncbi:peroxiredoxin-6-like [Symsagittifera roscoffensis]|uniref:peroxiredoxin-6-like n=1 Tax=Symsagittifera roscoffensis TaxID=84072 RepID=UPI00307B9FCD
MSSGPNLRLGSKFPNLSVKTTKGDFKVLEWKGSNWMLFFSHPADFTPVCTTEIGMLAKHHEEFAKRGVKLIGLSCDSVADHEAWAKDIFAYTEKYSGCSLKELPFPLIGDEDRSVAIALGMIDANNQPNPGSLPLTCRAVFIVGPDDLIKLFIYYPASTGRNFDELIRVVDSLQLGQQKKVATPANWNKGQKVMVVASATEEEAKKIDPNYEKVQVPSNKTYLRMAHCN